MAALGPRARGPLVDHDTYVLGPHDRMNVKVRVRTASIKVKRLVDSTEDGFELWQTETDARLPAPRETWQELASLLTFALDVDGMGTLVDPEKVVRALCGSAREIRCVEIAKERSSFVIPPGRVEFAKLIVADASFTSIAFEATALSAARALRSLFSGPELGEPANYISFCSRGVVASPTEPRPPSSP